ANIDDMQQSPLSASHTSPILSPSIPTISSSSSSSLQQFIIPPSPQPNPYPSSSDQQSLDTHLLHTTIHANMNNTRLSIRTLLNITESQQMRIVIHNCSSLINDLLTWAENASIVDMLATPVITIQSEQAVDIGGVLRDIVESFWEQIRVCEFPIFGPLFTNNTLTPRMHAVFAQETRTVGRLLWWSIIHNIAYPKWLSAYVLDWLFGEDIDLMEALKCISEPLWTLCNELDRLSSEEWQAYELSAVLLAFAEQNDITARQLREDSPQEIANLIKLSTVLLSRRHTLEKFKEGFDVDFGHGARGIEVTKLMLRTQTHDQLLNLNIFYRCCGRQN